MKFKEAEFLEDFIEKWTEGNDTGTMPTSDDLWEFLDGYLAPDIEDWLEKIEEPIRESFKILSESQTEWEQHVKEHSGPL